MTILPYFIFIPLFLGLGGLMSVVIPSRAMRIGLGAVFFLALNVDSTWILAPIFGWSPALGDVVFVGILLLTVLIFLLVIRRRKITNPRALSWPSKRDLAVFGVVILFFGAIISILPVPLDTDAQGFGYLALALRDGRNFTSLAPWHPEIRYLYSPGYPAIIAYLSAHLNIGIQALEIDFSAVIVILFIWLAFDLGNEIGDQRTGRAFLLAALIGTGLITAFFDSHFTAILALTFALAFIIFILRFLNARKWPDGLAAAICLAAVPFCQPDVTIALIIGYIPWLFLVWLSIPRPNLLTWFILAAIIPLVALGLAIPWLLTIYRLLLTNINSPFSVDLSQWQTMVLPQGVVIVFLAAVGFLIGLRKRNSYQVWMMIWLIGCIDFSMFGFIEKAVPVLAIPLTKYAYPFSLAWHGPIIPYMILGGTALVWFGDKVGRDKIDRLLEQIATPLCLFSLCGIIITLLFFKPLLSDSKKTSLSIFGAFSSQADVDAMTWLRDNTPKDSLVLNHPGPYEADWAPVISERNTIYFRQQPFFQGNGSSKATQAALLVFWRNSGESEIDYASLLDSYHINYILIPQIFGNPSSYPYMLRWRPPLSKAQDYFRTDIGSTNYLELVYEKDGAQIYRVIPPQERRAINSTRLQHNFSVNCIETNMLCRIAWINIIFPGWMKEYDYL